MIMKYLRLLFCLFIALSVSIKGNPQGIFDQSSDIGNPKNPGSAIFNSADQSYSLKGAGYNIWFDRDEFHYLYKKVSGDFILTAQFRFEGRGTDPHRKTGWMLRADTRENSPHLSATLHGDGLTVMQ